jgi:hypothetical protein
MKTVVGINRVREGIVGYRLVFEVFGMSTIFLNFLRQNINWFLYLVA